VKVTKSARLLQKAGVAAFVLKYRTMEKRQQGIPTNIDMDQACRYGIADGIQAIKVVRQHGAEWGVSPDRVGIIGFSARGMVASGAPLQQNAAARPSFDALNYGAPFGVMPAIPHNLPQRGRNRKRTSSTPVDTASACASRAGAATTGSTISYGD